MQHAQKKHSGNLNTSKLLEAKKKLQKHLKVICQMDAEKQSKLQFSRN